MDLRGSAKIFGVAVGRGDCQRVKEGVLGEMMMEINAGRTAAVALQG